MTGAIIPDDWDGETFENYCVVWPHSFDYEALLLGLMTTPLTTPAYFDQDTGDEAAALAAIQKAYRETIFDFPEGGCDVARQILVPTFVAYKDDPEAIPASSWVTVHFDTYQQNKNGPGFDLALNAHIPDANRLLGVWQYSVIVKVADITDFELIAKLTVADLTIAHSWVEQQNTNKLVFNHVWEGLGDKLQIVLNSTGATDFVTGLGFTEFSGHWVGPTDFQLCA